jgi:hypothetical protein
MVTFWIQTVPAWDSEGLQSTKETAVCADLLTLNTGNRLGMVLHTCNSNYVEAEMGGSIK